MGKNLSTLLSDLGCSEEQAMGLKSFLHDRIGLGIHEYILCVAQDVSILPLRMGYERRHLAEGKMFYLQVKTSGGVSGSLEELEMEEALNLIRRLPRLHPAARGAEAIKKQVRTILTTRVIETFEPPWPKDDPAYWRQWSRYCCQGGNETLGVYLSLAIKRLNEALSLEEGKQASNAA